jgi:hypothetical protein
LRSRPPTRKAPAGTQEHDPRKRGLSKCYGALVWPQTSAQNTRSVAAGAYLHPIEYFGLLLVVLGLADQALVIHLAQVVEVLDRIG